MEINSELRSIAEELAWTPAQVRACETVARVLGHDWATRGTLGVAEALGLPLTSANLALANRVRWEAFYRADPRRRDLFCGATGPGIPGPSDVYPADEPIAGVRGEVYGFWPLDPRASHPGGQTPSRRFNWFALRNGGLWLWAERPEPGCEGQGLPGRVVVAAFVGPARGRAYDYAEPDARARHLEFFVRAFQALEVDRVGPEHLRPEAWAASLAPDWGQTVEEEALV